MRHPAAIEVERSGSDFYITRGNAHLWLKTLAEVETLRDKLSALVAFERGCQVGDTERFLSDLHPLLWDGET